MRKLHKLIFIILIIIAVMIISKGVEATSITVSPSSPKKGESVTITVSVANVNTVDLTATVSGAGTSGTIRLVDGSMTGEPKTFSKSITVTPTTTGTISVAISSSSNAVLNGSYVDVTASKNITVTEIPPQEPEPEKPTTTTPSTNNKPTTNNNTTTVTKSSNSKLGKLEIAEGTITPEFSSSVKEYSISVPNEVTKLSISAVADSSKATVRITGNDELVVGENEIEVTVTAEDGSKTTYTILATRKQPQLSLKELSVYYIDENSEKVLLQLDPQFSFDIYEYSIIDKLPYTVKDLIIEANANRENAIIEILGNEELKAGENTITIKTTITDEAGLEEKKTYTIKIEKEEEPVITALTPLQKIKNWFSGIGAGITSWATANFDRIITGMLLASTATFVGLTVYFIYDYKNYKKVLAKLAELNKSNLMERANVALDPEVANKNLAETENIEEIETQQSENENIKIEEENIVTKTKKARGKRFK